NSRTRSAALATTKLFRCFSALRSGSMQDSGGCCRRLSRAAICSSKLSLPAIGECVTRPCRGGPLSLGTNSYLVRHSQSPWHRQHGSCNVSCQAESDCSSEASRLKQGNHSNSQQGKGHSSAGNGGEGKDRHLHNPIEDRLIPLEPLDLARVHSIDDLVRAMAKTAFTGRQLGEAADVLEAMARDKDCFVVMTLAGAMTVAKQGLVIAELIDRGIVHAIVSTGALMAPG